MQNKKVNIDFEKIEKEMSGYQANSNNTREARTEFICHLDKLRDLADKQTQNPEESKLREDITTLRIDLCTAQADKDAKTEADILSAISERENKLKMLEAAKEAAKAEIVNPRALHMKAQPLIEALVNDYERYLEAFTKKQEILQQIDTAVLDLYEFRERLCNITLDMDRDSVVCSILDITPFMMEVPAVFRANRDTVSSWLTNELANIVQLKKAGKWPEKEVKGKYLFDLKGGK